MNNFEAILDYGSKNLRLGVFDKESKNVYFSKVEISNLLENNNLEFELNKLIRDAEKYLSTHLVDINILYDTYKYNFIELSIKRTFDQPTSIKLQYDSLLQEANFLVSENNFKNQIIHIIVNNTIVDDDKKLEKISEDIKINSLILEIKFICLNKSLINDISEKFKKNNLKILNIYCSSYVKTIFYNKDLEDKNNNLFLDIGHDRTTALLYNNFKFQFINSIPMGGNSITKDISKVLKLSINYSEDLKINFNYEKKNISSFENPFEHAKLSKEILKNNISIDLLKQIIEARISEIIELSVIQNNYFKKIYELEKPNIIFIGNGSKVLSNNINLDSKKTFSKLIFFDESESLICDAGIYYHNSIERFKMPARKKRKKTGFFEYFFNLFSK